MRLKIAILAGDGIGPEVTNEAVNILKAVAEPEVHYVRTKHISAVVEIRIEHLRSQRLPAARRTAVHRPRPSLADAVEHLLHIRNQLLRDGIPIRAGIGRVHRIGIVEVRSGVLYSHNDDPWHPSRDPILIELIARARTRL